METDYAIEVQFYKETFKFCVIFDTDNSYDPFLKGRRITTCHIIENPNRKIYSGASIRNPNDLEFDGWIGRKWAYKRAVYYLWMVWNDTRKITMAFEPFWQLFRSALGKNELYLEDRRAYNG